MKRFVIAYMRDLKVSMSLSHLLTVQFCQSFAFYGIRSAFILYLTQKLAMKDVDSLRVYGNFMGFLYVSPLLGGILIDRYWSAESSLMWGVGTTVLGTFLITFPYHETLFFGAAIVIVGQGFFKPVVPFLMDQAYQKSGSTREASYTLYYILINVGGTLAPLLCGLVRDFYGWGASFTLMVGVGLLGLLLIAKIRKESTYQKLDRLKILYALLGVAISVSLLLYVLQSPHVVDQLVSFTLPLLSLHLLYLFIASRERFQLFFIYLSLVMVVVFVSLFEQSGGAMTLFLERHVNRTLFYGYVVPTASFQSLNPLFVIILGSFVSYLWVNSSHASREWSALLRLALGFGLTMVGFGILWLSCQGDGGGDKVDGWWIVIAIAFHTLGELCVIPMTLSLITHLAPARMKGTAIGLWSLSIAYGHYLASGLSRFAISSEHLPHQPLSSFTSVFLLTTQIAGVGCVILLMIKVFLKFLCSWEAQKSFGKYKI